MLNDLKRIDWLDRAEDEFLVDHLLALEGQGWVVDLIGHKGRPARIRISATMTKAAAREGGVNFP